MILFLVPLLAFLFFILERRLYRKVWRKKLGVSVSFSSSVIRSGEEVVATEITRNSKGFPLPSFSLEWGLERLFAPYSVDGKPVVFSTLFALPGRKEVIHKSTIKGLKRGKYTVSECKMTSTDLFSSELLSSSFPIHSSFTVLPGRVEGFSESYAYRGFLGTVISRRMSQDDPFEVKAIRPYAPTDPMRSINWKVSARTGSLKTNQYEWTTDESVTLVLSFGRGSEEENEKLIEYASSFAFLLLSRGITLSMISDGRSAEDGEMVSLGKGSGKGHSLSLDMALSGIKVTSTSDRDYMDLLKKVESVDGSVPVLFSASLCRDERKAFFAATAAEGAIFLLKGEEGEGIYMLEDGHEE